jgi:hypothetical protein
MIFHPAKLRLHKRGEIEKNRHPHAGGEPGTHEKQQNRCINLDVRLRRQIIEHNDTTLPNKSLKASTRKI